jgi:hypothetical protein
MPHNVALRALFLACCGALTSCASGSFTSQPVTPFGTPYEGLDENSYGQRSASQFRYCDPQDNYGSNVAVAGSGQAQLGDATHAFAATITAAVGAPIQAAMKVDTTLADLDMTRLFRIPADSNHPAVAVLSHSKDGIVFWHSAKLVRLQEVAPAAQAFCERFKKRAVYRGSASRCPPPERGLGGMAVIGTHAISAYACAAAP